VVFCRVGFCDYVRAVVCVFEPTPLRVARCECELVSFLRTLWTGYCEFLRSAVAL